MTGRPGRPVMVTQVQSAAGCEKLLQWLDLCSFHCSAVECRFDALRLNACYSICRGQRSWLSYLLEKIR